MNEGINHMFSRLPSDITTTERTRRFINQWIFDRFPEKQPAILAEIPFTLSLAVKGFYNSGFHGSSFKMDICCELSQ